MCFICLNACLIFRIKYEIVVLQSSTFPAGGKGVLQYGIIVLQLQMKECYSMVSKPRFRR
jgi:hypothetical protein